MKRRETLLGLMGLLALPAIALAQRRQAAYRLGYLDLGTRQSAVDTGRLGAFARGMQERGYVEHEHYSLIARFADGDAARLPGLAAELVRLKPNLIVTTGAPATQAAQIATTSIPIVVTVTPDPVRDGFALTLARPGGNITGLSSGAAEVILKQTELLTGIVPRLSRVGVLLNPANISHAALMLRVQATLRPAGKEVLPALAGSPEEVERGIAGLARQRADALIVLIDTFFLQQRHQIADLALKHQIPSVYANLEYAAAGGLLCYALDTPLNFHEAASFVDKILRGQRPEDLPFQLPKRYQLVINRKTARALKLTIPHEILLRADQIID